MVSDFSLFWPDALVSAVSQGESASTQLIHLLDSRCAPSACRWRHLYRIHQCLTEGCCTFLCSIKYHFPACCQNLDLSWSHSALNRCYFHTSLGLTDNVSRWCREASLTSHPTPQHTISLTGMLPYCDIFYHDCWTSLDTSLLTSWQFSLRFFVEHSCEFWQLCQESL